MIFSTGYFTGAINPLNILHFSINGTKGSTHWITVKLTDGEYITINEYPDENQAYEDLGLITARWVDLMLFLKNG